MKATISIICNNSRLQKNGEYPLVLRITKDRKRKYQYLGISVKPQHWDFTRNKPKPNYPNKELITKIILEKEKEYNEKILELEARQKDFTAASLVENPSTRASLKTVGEFYQEIITDLEEAGKVGNRNIYRDSLNYIKTFTGNKLNFPFSDIDVSWLRRYERFFIKKGCKDTTISLQFRTLRSAYNKAIEARAASKKHYPFDEYKVSKFDTTTRKRAISKEELKRIIELDLSGQDSTLQFGRDIFVFSYLTGDINFTDIANLKAENIVKGRVEYKRQKTGKFISIVLQREAREILDFYASRQLKSDYLFPVLDVKKHVTPSQKQNRIHKVLRQVNESLATIGQLAGIDTRLTTYVARHTFASVLKKSGVNVALISEALGHSDLTTTRIYLDSFDNTQLDAAMQHLV